MSTDILRDVLDVYHGSDGEATKALYAQLEALGPAGVVAVNLFRACKTSERAKKYRGGDKNGSYRSQAYATKEWSIGNLAKELVANAPALGLTWGWGIDEMLQRREDPHHHVLYVKLPTGQVSFHTSTRGDGPDYPGQWDGVRHASSDRICRWVFSLLNRARAQSEEASAA